MAGAAVWLLETGSARVRARAYARVKVSGMAATVGVYVRFCGIFIGLAAELSSVAQNCRVWHRIVEWHRL